MKVSLCYYICCVLLFQYSIAAPPKHYRGDDFDLNFLTDSRTPGGSLIVHKRPRRDSQHGDHSASQPGQSLPSLSPQSPSRRLLIPHVRPAGPQHGDHSASRPGQSLPSLSHQDGFLIPPVDYPNFTSGLPRLGPSGMVHHSYAAGPSARTPYHHSISHPRTPRPSQASPQGGSEQRFYHPHRDPRSQDGSGHRFPSQQQLEPPLIFKGRGACQMCGEWYEEISASNEYLRHSQHAKHVRKLSPGPHTEASRM